MADRPGPGLGLVPVAALILLLVAPVGPWTIPGGVVGPAHGGPPTVIGAASAIRDVPAGAIVRPSAVAGGGESHLFVSTSDANAVPNDGVRTNLTAFVPSQLPLNSSFQASAEEVIGPYAAVFGLFENDHLSPTAFFSVFDNRTDATLLGEFWTFLTIIPGESYDFALEHYSGTTWELTVNGRPFGSNLSSATFDFKSNESTYLEGLFFSEVAIYESGSPVPAELVLPLAIAVHRPSGWYLPVRASTSFNGAGGLRWGVEGRDQHPTLAPGEIDTGSTIANVTNGTSLWSSGPVNVLASLTLAKGHAVATDAFPVFVQVTSFAGSPIPGVSVYLNDSHNGTFLPSTVVTNGTGGGEAFFETPNVSANVSDRVDATVTTFGYRGGNFQQFVLSPAIQLVLTVSPPHPTIALNHNATLTVRATALNGSPVSGVLMSLHLLGPGGISPSLAATGSDGSVSFVLTAPNVATTVTVQAEVLGSGYWGSTSVAVRIANSPPPFYITQAPLFVGVGVVVAVGVAAGLIVWRFRTGKRTIPQLAIDDEMVEPGASGTPAGPATEPPAGPAQP